LINKDILNNILLTRVINAVIKIKDNLFLVLFSANLNNNLIKHLNNNNFNVKNHVKLSYNNLNKIVKSNVVISAAFTAYARIEMIRYKNLEGYIIYYTETDSIFTNKPLPSHLVGDNLGQMKEELKGKVIKNALFLGNKKIYLSIFRGQKNI